MAQHKLEQFGSKGMRSSIGKNQDGGFTISIFANSWPEELFRINFSEPEMKQLVDYLKRDYLETIV